MRFTYIGVAALAALLALPAQAAETHPGLDTEYGELLPGDGARLRTIVTRPKNATGRLPAVLFIQWLSCDSIELAPNAKNGWSVMLRRLITESGMLWQRTDKSGVGASKGTPCAQLDYETELAHHRAALRQLRSRPDVDPKRIVVFGASMGSNYAPLVAAGEDVAGVVVWGGGAQTWFERMLRFERNALELGDSDPQQLADEVNARAAYFARYLLKAETPAQIAARDPQLGEVWRRIVGTSDTGHYGRPFAFDQQAQRQNWAGAWNRVHAPVLVLYGEYDWFESRDAARLIADIVNNRQPGSAAFKELPQLDHHFTRYASRRDAFREKDGKENAEPAVRAILDWLTQIGVRPRDARAQNVLDLGVTAMGGRAALAAIATVRREFIDTWIDPAQGQRPWHGGPGELPPPNNGGSERTPVVSSIDYAHGRWLESQEYLDPPEEYVRVLDAVGPERGFRTIEYRDEQPFFDQFAASDLPAMTTRKLRRHPEGILQMALARAQTLEWVDDDVISFADPLGTRVQLYFDARTHLLAKAETARDHPLMGRTSNETSYSDYRAVGALQLPFKYLDRSLGAPTRTLQMTAIQLDAAPSAEQFTPPSQFVAVRHPPDAPRLEKISDSLYLVRGPYNVMFSVFPRDVVVFEAPLSPQYGEQILQLVRSVAGSKPIRCVVASHFHSDHLAGLAAFVAQRIPIIAPPDAKETIERAMTLNGLAATVEVTQQKVLDRDGVHARVYDFGPAPHVAQMLGAYFPDEKLLYVADLLDVLTEQLVIAGTDAVPLRRKIRELGLDVQRFVPVHGLPINGEQFEAGYRIRAKSLTLSRRGPALCST